MPILPSSRHVPVLTGLLLAALAAVVPTASQAAGCPGADVPIAALSDGQVRVATVCELNVRRRAAGLPTLSSVPSLTRVAQRHTRVMVVHHVLAHGDIVRRMRGYTAGHAFMVGENVGTADGPSETVSGLVEAWMSSPEHRDNILQPRFRNVGVGVVRRAADGSSGATMTTSFGWRG